MAALLRQFSQLLLRRIDAKIFDAHRHPDLPVKCFHRFDAFSRGLDFVCSGFHSHHIDRELREPLRLRIHHISRPASPDSRKACAVRHIKHTAQFMLQLMARPVSAVRPTAGKPVVGKASCPHHLRSRVIMIGLFHKNPCVLHHSADQMFTDAVRQFHVVALIKVAFHRVHHDIHTSAGCLVFRQCHGKLRVHDRESCPAVIAAVASFQPSVLIRDDRRITHLRSCRGDRQHNSDGQTAGSLTFSRVEIPHIPFICHAVSDGLGRVDDASAAYCKDKIHAFLLTQADPFIDKRQSRVRHNASERYIRDPRLVQRPAHPLQKPALLHAAASVVYQHLTASLRPDQLAGLFLCSSAEDNLRRRIVIKILHPFSPSRYKVTRSRSGTSSSLPAPAHGSAK